MKINIDIIKNIGKDKLILLIIAGVVLVLCTMWESDEGDDKNTNEGIVVEETGNPDDMKYTEEYIGVQEKKLAEMLCQIEGVENVHVMITVKNGASKDVLMERDVSYEDTSEDDGAGGKRNIYTYSEDNQTVYVTDENGKTIPYVLSRMTPDIEGVAVIAHGAENVLIKEKIINLIKALFGIDINKISETN